MNSVTLGRLVLLVIVIGLCVGGYRWYAGRHVGTGGGATGGGASSPLGGLLGGGGDKTGGASEIGLLTTATKADWLNDQINAFNQQHQGQYHVMLTPPLESRDAMHQILEKRVQPILWSPSSPVWTERLGSVWAQQNNGYALVDFEDPNDFKVYLRSPMVFLTTKAKAGVLRPALGNPDAWRTIRALSMKSRHVPWGRFTFAYADPLVANSGMLALGMILNDYAQHTGQTGDLASVASSAGFTTYLEELHRGFVYDTPVGQGSTQLADAYADDPSHYDFIVTYESTALGEVAKNPDLSVIYPSPTIMTEQSVAVLNGPWVSDEQKQGAQAFISFLSTRDALADGVKYNFRPEHATSDISLAAQLNENVGHGFQQSVVSVDLPPYDAINSAIYQWRLHVAHKSPPN